MKKILSAILAAVMLVSVFTVIIGAEGETAVETCVKSQERPDWLITEIANDTEGDGSIIESYKSPVNAKDCFEAIEIYNNSGKTLSLYDYCLTYNGDDRKNPNFEHQIKEITPFLTNSIYEDKVGNYFDGNNVTNGTYVFNQKNMGDLTLVTNDTMKNPATCMVEPGECVVIWMMYYESYLNCFNDNPETAEIDGIGLTVADFRKFWSIPDDVKVILADANSSVSVKDNTNTYVPVGGDNHNFNMKNSGCGTYGIAKYTEELVKNCNTPKEDGSQGAGIMTEGYWTYEDLICWASVDFGTGRPINNIANLTINFGYDFDRERGVASELKCVWSGARMALISCNCEPSFGRLTDLQKLLIDPESIPGGTTLNLDGYDYHPFIRDEVINGERIKYTFAGYEINGEKIAKDAVYTVPLTGISSLKFNFETSVVTTEPDDDWEDTPAETTTKAPVADTTPTPETTPQVPAVTTTEAPKDDKPSKSCGSMSVAAVVAVVLTAVFGSAIVIKKK